MASEPRGGGNKSLDKPHGIPILRARACRHNLHKRNIALPFRRNMVTGPVLLLLLFDLLLFLAAAFYFDKSEQKWENLLLSALFLFSGMPALIYQVVWQRTLFSIYGVNAESVAVVVSAFMLGLGLGSLAGGWLSARFPRQGILIFGLAELGIAVFGLSSLQIFRWAAAYTAGANLLSSFSVLRCFSSGQS
jgi:hypothetical protein